MDYRLHFCQEESSTWVLVADDKPEYLPYKGTIVCEKELIKRQLLRMRADLEVFSLAEIAIRQNRDIEAIEGQPAEELELLETLRVNGEIDGYVISRGKFSQIRTRVRRHTLGMQRENQLRSLNGRHLFHLSSRRFYCFSFTVVFQTQ